MDLCKRDEVLDCVIAVGYSNEKHSLKERMMEYGMQAYVGAPGGFGKSLAVSQWLAPQRNKHAWITLDPYDNNEGRFVRKFLGGLAFAQRANRRLARAAERVKPPFLEYLFDALDLLLPNTKKYVLRLYLQRYSAWHKPQNVF